MTPWTIVHQTSLSRQEYWSGLPFPFPGDLPDPGIEPESLAFPALAGRFFATVPPGKPVCVYIFIREQAYWGEDPGSRMVEKLQGV